MGSLWKRRFLLESLIFSFPASPQQRLFGWRPQRKLCKHLRRQIWPACQAGQGTEHCEVAGCPWSSIIIHPWKSEAPQGTSIYHRSFPRLQIDGMCILPETSRVSLEFEAQLDQKLVKRWQTYTPVPWSRRLDSKTCRGATVVL